MSIDNLTIGQFKELSVLMQSGAQAPAPTEGARGMVEPEMGVGND